MPKRIKATIAPPTFQYEQDLTSRGYARIAGVDEAGRGPLAGPVVAGAVILPFDFSTPHSTYLNDSKQLEEEMRDKLFDEIKGASLYGVGVVEASTIDAINIRQASWKAMQMAVADLQSKMQEAIDYVLIDGLPYGPGPWPYEALVKGDSRSLSIAAASVIAKVTRDRLMEDYHKDYPVYGFAKHKGYPTPQHIHALEQYGPCVLHRCSFAPVKKAIQIRLEL